MFVKKHRDISKISRHIKDITIYKKIQYFLTIPYIDIKNDISIFSIYRVITKVHHFHDVT